MPKSPLPEITDFTFNSMILVFLSLYAKNIIEAGLSSLSPLLVRSTLVESMHSRLQTASYMEGWPDGPHLVHFLPYINLMFPTLAPLEEKDLPSLTKTTN